LPICKLKIIGPTLYEMVIDHLCRDHRVSLTQKVIKFLLFTKIVCIAPLNDLAGENCF